MGLLWGVGERCWDQKSNQGLRGQARQLSWGGVSKARKCWWKIMGWGSPENENQAWLLNIREAIWAQVILWSKPDHKASPCTCLNNKDLKKTNQIQEMTMLMLTFSDLQDFNQLKLGLCLPAEPLHEYACPLILKLPQFCCRWDTASPVVSSFSASNKSFPIFGFVVPCGSTPRGEASFQAAPGVGKWDERGEYLS